MKASYFLGLFLFGSLFFTSCKSNTEQPTAKDEVHTQLMATSATVKWTAYKTTAKAPVGGEFKTIDINTGQGETWKDALANTSFTINADDFTTGDDGRDKNIRDNFFNVMNEPGSIQGEFDQDGENWVVSLTLNGVTVNKIPCEVSFENNTATIKSTVHLEAFNALSAIASLDKVCGDLHKGKDGISKTWTDVDVVATLGFEQIPAKADQ